jgi:hypothetical protein
MSSRKGLITLGVLTDSKYTKWGSGASGETVMMQALFPHLKARSAIDWLTDSSSWERTRRSILGRRSCRNSRFGPAGATDR